MPITFTDITDNFRRIVLDGRMDIPGTAEVEMKLASLSSTTARRVVLDLSAVTFLASIGIRAIISNAKALHRRGGQDGVTDRQQRRHWQNTGNHRY